MISASHNPFADNGIKLFAPGGRKLPDDVEAAIEAELDAVLAGRAGGPAASDVGDVVERRRRGRRVRRAPASRARGPARLDGLRVVARLRQRRRVDGRARARSSALGAEVDRASTPRPTVATSTTAAASTHPDDAAARGGRARRRRRARVRRRRRPGDRRRRTRAASSTATRSSPIVRARPARARPPARRHASSSR